MLLSSYILLNFSYSLLKSIEITILHEKDLSFEQQNNLSLEIEHYISLLNKAIIDIALRIHIQEILPYTKFTDSSYYNLIYYVGTNNIGERAFILSKIRKSHVIFAINAIEDTDGTDFNIIRDCDSIYLFNINFIPLETTKLFTNAISNFLSDFFKVQFPELKDLDSENLNIFKEKLKKSQVFLKFVDCKNEVVPFKSTDLENKEVQSTINNLSEKISGLYEKVNVKMPKNETKAMNNEFSINHGMPINNELSMDYGFMKKRGKNF